MNNSLTQRVHFRGGMQDGKTAKVTFALPFSLEAKITFPEGTYRLAIGPIALAIARSQEPMYGCALCMVPVDTSPRIG